MMKKIEFILNHFSERYEQTSKKTRMQFQLRDYQVEALEACSRIPRGGVYMATGSGKSIIEYLLINDSKEELNILITPTLNLVKQFSSTYFKEDERCFNICSLEDDGVDGNDCIMVSEVEKMQRVLMLSGHKILITTYISFPALMDIIRSMDLSVGMLIADEAHHICDKKVSKYFQSQIGRREYFFTASPEFEKKNGIVMVGDGMTIGKLVYKYSYRRGIEEGRLSDYELHCAVSADGGVNRNKENVFKTIHEAFKKGNNHVITYHTYATDLKAKKSSSVEKFLGFRGGREKELKALHDKSFLIGITGEKIIMSASTNLTIKYRMGISVKKTPSRMDVLTFFNKHIEEDELCVLSSCETLNEGVDTVEADVVLFVDACDNLRKIIQRIGRAGRLKAKPRTTLVIVNVVLDKKRLEKAKEDSKLMDEYIRNSGQLDFNPIFNVVAALKEDDMNNVRDLMMYPHSFGDLEKEESRQKKEFYLPAIEEKDREYEEEDETESDQETEESDCKESVQMVSENAVESDQESEDCEESVRMVSYESDQETKEDSDIVPTPFKKVIYHINPDIEMLLSMQDIKMVDNFMLKKIYIDVRIKKSDEERLEELAVLTGWPKKRGNQSLYSWLNNRVKRDGEKTEWFDRMSSEHQEQLVRITSSWGSEERKEKALDEERLEELAVLTDWPKISENRPLYDWINKRVKRDGEKTKWFDRMSSEHQEQLVRITSSWGYEERREKASDEELLEELAGLTDWPKQRGNKPLYNWLNNRVKKDGRTTPIFDKMSSEHQEQLVRITSSWGYKSDEEQLEELAVLTDWPKQRGNKPLYNWLNNRVKKDGEKTDKFYKMPSEHQEQLVRITSSWGYEERREKAPVEEPLEELEALIDWPKQRGNRPLYHWLNKRVKTDGSTTPIFDKMSSEHQEQLVRITSSWGYKQSQQEPK